MGGGGKGICKSTRPVKIVIQKMTTKRCGLYFMFLPPPLSLSLQTLLWIRYCDLWDISPRSALNPRISCYNVGGPVTGTAREVELPKVNDRQCEYFYDIRGGHAYVRRTQPGRHGNLQRKKLTYLSSVVARQAIFFTIIFRNGEGACWCGSRPPPPTWPPILRPKFLPPSQLHCAM